MRLHPIIHINVPFYDLELNCLLCLWINLNLFKPRYPPPQLQTQLLLWQPPPPTHTHSHGKSKTIWIHAFWTGVYINFFDSVLTQTGHIGFHLDTVTWLSSQDTWVDIFRWTSTTNVWKKPLDFYTNSVLSQISSLGS